MRVNVQFGKVTVPLDVDSECESVAGMASKFHEATDVPVHKQKFIYKGKVLLMETPLSAYALKEGCKVLMLASGTQSKGQVLAAEVAAKNAAAAASRRDAYLQDRLSELASPAPTATRPLKDRAQKWRDTGIVSLRGLDLTQLPDGLGDLGPSVYACDVGNNHLRTLPDVFLGMQGLQKLRASHNALTGADAVPWTTLSLLPRLEQLLLDHNALTAAPAALFQASALRVLDLGHNALSGVALPDAIAGLPLLDTLNVESNALTHLPAALGMCAQLQSINACSNKLRSIPPSLGLLHKLQTLQLAHNHISAVPRELLEGATTLHTLILTDNPITMQQLREVPGHDAFLERRKGRLDKIVEMKVGADFDEGVDYAKFHRH